TQLSCGRTPAALEHIRIWESLQPCALTHCEVAYTAVCMRKHIFPSGDTVISGFKRLRWPVKAASSMAGIAFRAWYVQVVSNDSLIAGGFHGIAQVSDCIANSLPG